MNFVQPAFFLFLAAFLLAFFTFISLYNGLRLGIATARLAVLFFSLFFYGFHRPDYLVLIIGISSAVYYLSSLPFNGRLHTLAFPVLISSLPLIYFKYGDFMARSVGYKWAFLSPDSLALPLGISFFTFQNLSYLVGRFRGVMLPANGLTEYLAYITFFPQLVAGPIVTADRFLPQIRKMPEIRQILFSEAAFYLVSGYFKKVVLADRLALIVDPVYVNPGQISGIDAITGVLAYSLQIYFDFSAYSDIAIGLGLLVGIRLPENFNFPYLASGFREFWRRWHITLSTWLRDHLFIPLGGSRHGIARTGFALLVTMLLGGLWHGAHWLFVFWGFAHGLLLIVERTIPKRFFSYRMSRFLFVVFTFVLVTLLWIPFRAGSVGGFSAVYLILDAIFTLRPGSYSESGMRFVVLSYLGLALASIYYVRWKSWYTSLNVYIQGGLFGVVVLFLVLLASGGETFIYFVF